MNEHDEMNDVAEWDIDSDSYVQKNDDGTITVLLEYPIPSKMKDKDPTSEITLRRPKGNDLMASDLVDGEQRKNLAVIASMAGKPLKIFGDMDSVDLERLSNVAMELRKKSPKTGGG